MDQKSSDIPAHRRWAKKVARRANVWICARLAFRALEARKGLSAPSGRWFEPT